MHFDLARLHTGLLTQSLCQNERPLASPALTDLARTYDRGCVGVDLATEVAAIWTRAVWAWQVYAQVWHRLAELFLQVHLSRHRWSTGGGANTVGQGWLAPSCHIED